MSTATAETTIDKAFDQTAEHVHADGHSCPTCDTGVTPNGFHLNGVDCQNVKKHFGEPRTADDPRWIDLRNDLNRMTTRAIRAEERVKHFEKLTELLAVELDNCRDVIGRIQEDVVNVTRLAA